MNVKELKELRTLLMEERIRLRDSEPSLARNARLNEIAERLEGLDEQIYDSLTLADR